MALPAYSTRFFDIVEGDTGLLSATVPDGYIWDVRDVELEAIGQAGLYPSFDVVVYGAAGGVIFSLRSPLWVTGEHYHWDGRAVLNPGEDLLVSIGEPYVAGVITGYQLTQ